METSYHQSIEYCILSLIAFFDIFDHPLKLEEIKKFMYKYDVPDFEIEGIMHATPHLETKDEYWFLTGRVETVYLRKKRQEVTTKYWKRVYRFVPFLKHIPYVRMVAICNTLAMNTCDEDSDIDLFIVVEEGHLWLSRLLITTYFQLMGKRRHGKKVAGRFCLSFYTTTDSLDISRLAKEPYDIYLAYWISTMIPIFGEKYYEYMLSLNQQFLEEYFGPKIVKNNARISGHTKVSKVTQKVQEGFWNLPPSKKLEDVIKNWQKNRAKRKLYNLPAGHSNVVSDFMLKSHDHDKRDHFRQEYEERMGAMGLL